MKRLENNEGDKIEEIGINKEELDNEETEIKEELLMIKKKRLGDKENNKKDQDQIDNNESQDRKELKKIGNKESQEKTDNKEGQERIGHQEKTEGKEDLDRIEINSSNKDKGKDNISKRIIIVNESMESSKNK